MAENGGMNAVFPAPPPFYNHFTKQNLARLRQLRKDAGIEQPGNDNENTSKDNAAAKRDVDPLALPTELRYLIPPPLPESTKIHAFGPEVDLSAPEPSLEQSGIEKLYPDSPSVKLNPQPHLLALTRSLLTTFLGLTGVLSQNPELQEKRGADMQAIMFNIHDLINQYRPHQARESLIMLMEERVQKMREESRGIEEGREKVAKLLAGLREAEMAHKANESKGDVLDKQAEAEKQTMDFQRQRRQRAAWVALQEMG